MSTPLPWSMGDAATRSKGSDRHETSLLELAPVVQRAVCHDPRQRRPGRQVAAQACGHPADDDEHKQDQARPKDKDDRIEQDIDRKMNKTALVTLWVDPSSAQIVKYTFENVWMDFLPAAWLVRIDGLHASMEMEQPFPGVWLPRNLAIDGSVTTAPGSFSVNYRRDFANYRKADVSTRIRIPKGGR